MLRLLNARYQRIETNIGEGTYGKVHKARDTKTDRLVAIKKAKASAADLECGGISFTALREIKLMQAVQHPNVMGCLDVFVDGGVVHLVMDFMDSDLRRLVDDRSVVLRESHCKCLVMQILRAVKALHDVWFVHRDVTPTNILLAFCSGTAKLSDFGFSRTVGHGERPLTPMCTTLWYRAPELLYGARFYSTSVDLWSVGCVLAELFLRQALFPGSGEFNMLTRVFEKRGTPTEEVWRDVSALPSFVAFSHHPKAPMSEVVPTASAAAQDLLDGLLTLDPKLRPKASEALRHDFFVSASPLSCAPAELPFVRPAPES